ncbi:hypothetical protein M5689_004375 [Euphorbia peplus]|nr:hypothetical protein M5689_004375 [Euphorbia peplus]
MEPYSRLVGTATRYYRAFSLAHIRAPYRGFATGAETGSAGDHSGEDQMPSAPTGKPEETRDHYEPETGKREPNKGTEHNPPKKGTEPLVKPRVPFGSSPGLESTGVNNPAEPPVQQRRESTSTALLDDVECAGLDGTPLPEEREKNKQKDEEDDNEYYKHHKASPLSEIEIADTRKPITRATDGTMDAKGKDVMGWLPEQLDTAEEALERASRIFRENAMRGNPDSPHGRVLRQLRGEWF